MSLSWVRLSVLVVLPLVLVGCHNTPPTKPVVLEKQLRAVLTYDHGQWLASRCGDATNQRFQLKDDANFTMDANTLMGTPKQSQLFIDANGTVDVTATVNSPGIFSVKSVNRLMTDVNRGCHETDYPNIVVRAIGKNPLWVVSIAPKMLMLERVNQQPIGLAYVNERLPDGQMNFSTEGNGQKIDLWVAKERCLDSETNDVYAMRAILTVNYQTFQGCAYVGPSSGLLNAL